LLHSQPPNTQTLLSGVHPCAPAFLHDPGSDGVHQIADILAANNLANLATISIVAHGSAGELVLGSTMLTDGTLADHSAALAEIGATLGSGGTLQLFGCGVGQGAAGQQFVNDLSTLAGGINVAAASHEIRGAALGGSWTLDVTAGPGATAPVTAFAPVNVDGQPVSSGAGSRPTNSSVPTSTSVNADGQPVSSDSGSPPTNSA